MVKRRSMITLILVGSVVASPSGGAGAADCNRNGREDSLDLAEGTSADCNNNQVPDECDIAWDLAAEVSSHQLLPDLTDLAVGDFDGDDRADFLFATRRSGSGDDVIPADVQLALTGPEGELGEPRVLVELDADVSLVPAGPVAADLDGDGDLDFAFALSGAAGSDLHVVLQNGGEFSALSPVRVEVGSPRTLRAADLSGDGVADLVLVTATDVAVLFNRGNGEFGFWTAVPSVVRNLRGADVDVGDLDGNGALDLVFYCTGSPSGPCVWAAFNLDGFNFESEVILDDTGPEVPSGSVSASDLDGDGDVDLVLSRSGTLLLALNTGRRAYSVTSVLDVQGVSPDVAAHDFDGDGDADLAVAMPSAENATLVLYENEGDAFFRERQSTTFEAADEAFLLGDLDGDGLTDFVFQTEEGLQPVLNVSSKEASRDENANGVPDECELERPIFHRGDANADGALNLVDAVFLLEFLFGGQDTLPCRNAADSNNDASLNLADAVLLLDYLFSDGTPPAAPGPPGETPCGVDPEPVGSPGDLGCETLPRC